MFKQDGDQVHLHSLMPVWIQPEHSVGPLSASQRKGIWMSLRWQADGGPLWDVKQEELAHTGLWPDSTLNRTVNCLYQNITFVVRWKVKT